MKYAAVVVGASAGGMEALRKIFSNLSKNFKLPMLIVQHMHAHSDNYLARYLDSQCGQTVKEADEKEKICGEYIYLAPANYHLLIEEDQTLSLTTDERVNYCRPSIDILFESAADIYREKLIGIILTGANKDGTDGMKIIKKYKGLTVVQDPKTAEAAIMPVSVINGIKVDKILNLEEIAEFLNSL